MEFFTEQKLPETKAMQRVIANPEYTVTFITTAAESSNRLTEMEILLMPGGSNGLHKHLSFTETFIPIEGTLEVQAGKRKMHVTPGQAYTIPIGMPHNFANPGTEPVRFRVVIKPGHEGFEHSLRMLYGLANDGMGEIKTWDDMLRAAVILTISDMRLAGKQAFINPFLPLLYRLACRKGYHQEMRIKYCV